jgi:hypothetical protein
MDSGFHIAAATRSARAELVEALSFSFEPKEKQGFDRLSPDGWRACALSGRQVCRAFPVQSFASRKARTSLRERENDVMGVCSLVHVGDRLNLFDAGRDASWR